MKMGLLTFHDAINYGAVLQAVALAQAITNISGEKCEIVDYRCSAIDRMYQVAETNILKRFIKHQYQRAKRNVFRRFVRKNATITNAVTCDTIIELKDKYDGWVVGSDQVWNGYITGHDSRYLLDFVENKYTKLSYAASIGNYTIPENEERSLKNELLCYCGISIREPAGAYTIQKIIERDVEVHIDPTLLLKAEEWTTMAKAPGKKGKYIFIYASGNVKEIVDAAQFLAKKTGYLIYYMGNYKIPGGKKLSFVSPEKWLGYIKNAEYVLTNSFHGTVFATIFRKNFFVDLGKVEIRNGEETHHNDRAENLIKILGLHNRSIENIKTQWDIKPDWYKKEMLLQPQIKRSFDYLKKAMNV